MKITDLDEDRLQYIWSDYTEKTYQILQRVDKIEWRVYFTGFPRGERDRKENGWRIGTYSFLAYVDGVPTEYTHNEGVHTLYYGVSGDVTNDLLKRLNYKRTHQEMPYITKEQYSVFSKCFSWEEVESAVGLQ